MRICIISTDYPEEGRPVFTFVKNIVDALADRGNECIVIAPFSVTKNKCLHKIYETYTTAKGSVVEVWRPNYLSLSNLKLMGCNISGLMHKQAVNRALKKIKKKPDVMYCHFWISGLEGYPFAKKHNIPLFVASGESEIPQSVMNDKYKDFYDYVSGVICVSTKNKEESIVNGLTIAEKCVVIPNAINNNIFKKFDKSKCRKKLGINNNQFVVISTGAFINRKGTNRISSAISKISDDVYTIFIGSGPETPTCKNILFQGRVENKDIPTYLNAADVFVLPTLREGCCNAIIEAMACGLPIISSDKSFNWDILNDENSILVDPMDINKIAEAIDILKKNSDLRNKLGYGSLATVQDLTIEKRAEKIDNYIKENYGSKQY